MAPIFYFILEISLKKKILGVGCEFLVSKDQFLTKIFSKKNKLMFS